MNEKEIAHGYCALLDSCETRPREELLGQHRVMLERLCRHARHTTDFYAERLAPLFGPDDAFRLEAWDDIAPLTRGDLQEHFERLKSNSVPANFGGLQIASSSGSTGQPVRALWTDAQNIATLCMGRRLLRWHGIDCREFLVRLFSRPMSDPQTETQTDYWSPIYEALDLPGRAIEINGQLPVKQIVERLEALQPEHLIVNPRLMFALANEYLDRDARPSFMLKSISTFGETRTPAIDTRISEIFGRKPISRYAAEEVGNMALECPDCGNYHVSEEVTHVDAVDSALQPVRNGEIGRVLVTPLYSYAMPLIRYEIGDDVRLVSSLCTRAQQVSISAIVGRMGDLFRHPNGGMFRPNRDLLNALCRILGALATQVVQQEARRYLVRYHARNISVQPALQAASAQVQASFGFEANIHYELVPGIPTRPSGKREDFVCEAPATNDRGA